MAKAVTSGRVVFLIVLQYAYCFTLGYLCVFIRVHSFIYLFMCILTKCPSDEPV